MIAIFLKEIKAFLYSIVGYIVVTLFLTGVGLFMWVLGTTVLDAQKAEMNLMFYITPYVFMFLIPAITMKSFAEERKTGTMELLLTTPITEWQIILGKYLACFTLVVISLVPTLVYYASIYILGEPQGNIDSAGVFGSYIGLLFLAMTFTAIGILMSVITDSQIVAFLLSAFTCFFLYVGIFYIGELMDSNWVIEKGLDYHYNSLGKGVLDTRNIVYLVSLAVVMLSLTKLKLASRKW